jgi:hypothetical protein
LLNDYRGNPAALADFGLNRQSPGRVPFCEAARRLWGNRPGFGAHWAVFEAEHCTGAPTDRYSRPAHETALLRC